MGLPPIPKTGNTGQLTSLPEQTSSQVSSHPKGQAVRQPNKYRRSLFVVHKTKPRSLRHTEVRAVKPGGMASFSQKNIELWGRGFIAQGHCCGKTPSSLRTCEGEGHCRWELGQNTKLIGIKMLTYTAWKTDQGYSQRNYTRTVWHNAKEHLYPPPLPGVWMEEARMKQRDRENEWIR